MSTIAQPGRFHTRSNSRPVNAPIYSESAWYAPEMASVTRALERMLRQHEPFPAVVMDRFWNVLMANESSPRFFNCFISMAVRKSRRTGKRCSFDDLGLR
jgi:hypothetical protein